MRQFDMQPTPLLLDSRVAAVHHATKGFMPADEGQALFEWAATAAGSGLGPLLEIGTYCGKSALLLGAAARVGGTVAFSIDHHRGSEENQAGWEHHDVEVVDARTGRMDTLPFARRALFDAGLEQSVILVLGESVAVATHWSTPLAFCFIDGGHAEDIAMGDYESWVPKLSPEGLLAIHDVFERPEDGGQAPFHVWQRAIDEGFLPLDEQGSLRVLRGPSR